MADDADRAQELGALYERALRVPVRALKARVASDAAAPAVCADCGDAIPPARRAAWPGARRCLSCQQQHEAR
ncbi:hypothetical protein HL658_31295 [Azospirillum sp. RWY-5-1]|uniref:Zinc finger DksA/TraR C4-type domain-containing protein n=1 Tax=Azospirillum oleiclasticum TaxID=2735135 RepID=A0ABX2TLB3_9PROT|nr:TraR/DksA C4-type zinc finger protein [Azospirillum oleiclasticum]NYZ17051.1 hypothetical protein [Azospirillum oleiclasticum]NYZ24505.1 hypothetical protein [Azospirillum oleiclasticum]